ncbi:MAG TPA: hypothetical protein VFQ35_07680 [Polyangiaceae bacterium]|nr:hypothetical protein [Polyangiaceae bacterium]
MDLFGMLVLSAALGALVTAHVVLVAGLATQPPRWRALAAFFLPPLAPYWGFEARRYVWSSVWLFAAVSYVASAIAAAF